MTTAPTALPYPRLHCGLTSGHEVLRMLSLVAIGVALPALIHLVPSPVALGPILMPLMIPIALAAFLLPLRSAMAVVCGLPLLSMLISGMPPLLTAGVLMLEGSALVLVTRALMNRAPWWVALLAGMVANRAVALVASTMIALMVPGISLGLELWGTLQGFVGLAVVMAIMPVLFRLFRR